MDGLLALMLAGLVLLPLVSAASLPARVAGAVPLLWALCLVLMSVLLGGQTPGKRWLGLRLEGAGCSVCRELRRWGWLLIWAAAPLVQGAYGGALGLVAACLVLWLYLRPVWRGQGELAHNLATGFRVVRAL